MNNSPRLQAHRYDGQGSVKSNKYLNINEIFFSIQGESLRCGLPTVFIRLTGCPLRCGYCDTTYAFYKGEKMSVETILDKVRAYGAKYVTVTGGEPLAQVASRTLLSSLCDHGFDVSLETSGAMDITDLDQRVMIVMDIKTPYSKEADKNLWDNLHHLKPQDQIKFVICNRDDYLWAKRQLTHLNLTAICEVLFSAEHHGLSSVKIADWLLEDKLNVRLQIQLHKYLWGDIPGK